MTPDLKAKLRAILHDAPEKHRARLEALFADENIQEIKHEYDIEPSNASTWPERVLAS